ncbi:MAG: catechol 2,3-dioxygenase-like lactoylglutathione lyase family enzyme [Myxococcota bacterium]|jgi:catechol 2,3-dioxygenase-like lactoylglutathione lyase family enzyme
MHRIHVALTVSDLEKATAFYQTLFSAPPTKERPGYARFEPSAPPVNLALNQTDQPQRGSFPEHFGIQVGDADAVIEVFARLREAGYQTRSEESVSCCYAVSTKVWVSDPDGHAWEVFVTENDDAPHYAPPKAEPELKAEAQPDCCAPSCCQ